jgi:hypothetical protein
MTEHLLVLLVCLAVIVVLPHCSMLLAGAISPHLPVWANSAPHSARSSPTLR